MARMEHLTVEEVVEFFTDTTQSTQIAGDVRAHGINGFQLRFD